MPTTLETIFIIVAILILLALWLNSRRKRKISCPNGHTDSWSEIGHKPTRAKGFNSAKGTMGGTGFAQSYLYFAVTYQCHKCGETWTLTKDVR